MLFNSLEFFLFLPLIFILYWFVFQRNLKLQNALVLAASYVFYGWWDWRFLLLIFISSWVDFICGQRIEDSDDDRVRKRWMYLSVAVNLGMLGFFKYFNFFVESFIDAFSFIGLNLHINTLQIILPVGISFYTFQTLSYTIDVYRKRAKASREPISFFAFVSFFPQLVAGPIERAKDLIPQFEIKRNFSYDQAVSGAKLLLWGLFKKIVVADHCALHADEIFGNYTAYGGSDLFLGIYFFFAMQLYCDFSGYSDVAVGTARLFGFELSRNFAFPFFSRDIAEFWKRWHITLGTWFRDYMYRSMEASSFFGRLGRPTNLLLMFIAIGLWHGASWNFFLWGTCNGIWFLIHMKLRQNPKNAAKFESRSENAKMREMPHVIYTLGVAGLLLVFFRVPDFAAGVGYLYNLISWDFFTFPTKFWAAFLPLGLKIWEWQVRDRWHGLQLPHWKSWQRWVVYVLMVFSIFYYFGQERPFVYFQF